MSTSSFVELGVAEPLRRALTAEGYTDPTPIQTQAIPVLLEGRDILGLAQTGTGKTAAFSLPLLQRLCAVHQQREHKCVRALVLAPTRELAIQIGDSIRAYGRFMHLRHTVIVGGVSQHPQMKALASGVDILVATPGRLLDHMNQGNVRLDKVEILVLDEGDRMLDMGFIRDIRKIMAKLPRNRQSMLFSATMPTNVAELAHAILNKPVRIDITPKQRTAEKIEQSVYHVAAGEKRALLIGLLEQPALEKVLVFTRTKHLANRVAAHLTAAGVRSDAIHGNKSQGARQRALAGFRAGDTRVLVATDIAARGIDIDHVSHVINFDLPNEPESYVHRIGRTARAGASGIAISFCDDSERTYLRDIETLTRCRMTVAQERVASSAAPAPKPQNTRNYARPKFNRRNKSRRSEHRSAALEGANRA